MPSSEQIDASPAGEASRKALAAVYACLDAGQSFRLEAGAGAGKTYTLIKALQYLIAKKRSSLAQNAQRVACITFTNVAKDEITARVDQSPLIYCDTNHAFCWSLIKPFQKQLRAELQTMEQWKERLEEAGGIGDREVDYNLGHRGVEGKVVTLHHDDVIPMTIALMGHHKFRTLLSSQYPVILVDEYQDTDAAWIEAIKQKLIGQPAAPLFGFFGDSWQKIYGEGCGTIEHAALKEIGLKANVRSVPTIVDCLNRIRPNLPQFVVDPDDIGSVRVFHTNGWTGARQTGAHYGGDLPATETESALATVRAKLAADGWSFDAKSTRVLMLTHRALASQQGYNSLAAAFRYNDAFTKKDDPHVAYLVDVLDPACDAHAAHKFGAMFDFLGTTVPHLKSPTEKSEWATSFATLQSLRTTGTIGDVIDHCRGSKMPRLPDNIEEREAALAAFDTASEDAMPRSLEELKKLRHVAFSELMAVRSYLEGSSPFETKHGVKGAEFENVLVLVGRGWNRYNFGDMLEWVENGVPAGKQESFENNRNLFYVVCSRPKRRLALLFTQKLSDPALKTLTGWFGTAAIETLAF